MSSSFALNLFSVLDDNLVFEKKLGLGDCPAHGCFHFFIPEAVDEWVEHGNHRCVEHRHHLIEVQRRNGTWPHIDKEQSPVQNGNRCDMGRAGGEGFLPPLSGADPQDGHEDVKIGDYDGGAADNQDSSCHDEHQQFIDPYVSTYEGKDRRHVTEEMIDNVGATKRKSESSCSVSHGVEETNSIGSDHQLYAEPLGHGH